MIEDTLKDRGSRYGEFENQAALTQILKDIIHADEGWGRLSYAQKESLDMIMHKVGRIINGDPNYKDSWVDIEGYAHLISEKLKG